MRAAAGRARVTETVRRLHPSVVLRTEGDARFALHLESGQVVDLNETAALVLERLAQGASTPQIVEALRKAYPDASEDEARRDVEDLVGELQRLGFLA